MHKMNIQLCSWRVNFVRGEKSGLHIFRCVRLETSSSKFFLFMSCPIPSPQSPVVQMTMKPSVLTFLRSTHLPLHLRASSVALMTCWCAPILSRTNASFTVTVEHLCTLQHKLGIKDVCVFPFSLLFCN
jgi:hypothetical protein